VSFLTFQESNILNELDERTDEELVFSLARRFDERLFAEIYRRYSRKVYLWCYNYTHDVEEAVDLTQEVFTKIFQNISGFKGNSRFSTWVYSVTRNHCIGAISKKRREWFRRLKSMEEVHGEVDLDEEHKLMELAHDVDKLIGEAKGVMRDEEISAFIMHYRDGMTVKEITRVLGCENVTGARTLLQGARRKFKKLVDEA